MDKSFFLTKSSIKWVKIGQLTLKMALLKNYTSVLNIMNLKLVESARNHLQGIKKSNFFGDFFSFEAFLDVFGIAS